MQTQIPFHRPNDKHYFLTHSIGLMPSNASECIKESYFNPWQSASDDIWPQWLNEIGRFNSAIGQLFNSKADQFCPQANVSSGLSKVIQSLPEKENRKVLLASESDFPSTNFVLQQAKRLGFELRLIPKEQDLQSLDVWEKELTKDVHSVFITHVHYNTNTRVPVERISEICRARDVLSIVDVAQSAGIVPIDLATLNVDIVVGSCIKWLCGGAGAGFIWLDRKVVEQLNPMDVGWFSHQNPFEFNLHNFEYADSAARFWGGTPSVASYAIARNSVELITQIGVDEILKYNQSLCQKIIDCVPEDYVISPLNLNEKGGTVVLKFPDMGKVEKALHKNQILFDVRKYGLRLSPHLYTSPEDIDRLIDSLV